MSSKKLKFHDPERRPGRLFYGDNLDIMKEKVGIQSVDLIYLDPPFKSNQTYNLLYRNLTGKPVSEQAEAFADTWEMDAEKEEVARSTIPQALVNNAEESYAAEFWRMWFNALRNTQPHLMAYLIYMVERLLFMKSLLKKTGSIYLHCDPTASHYIKAMMDAIFGHRNFRNEIVWKRTSAHSSAKRWGPVHDVLLFYTVSDKYTWNKVYQDYEDTYTEGFYRHKDPDGRRYRVSDLTGAGVRYGASGEKWRGHDPTAKGRHWAPQRKFPGGEKVPKSTKAALDYLNEVGRIVWPAKKDGVPGFKRYLDDMEGVPIQDVVDDVRPVAAQGKDRLGYPTQKPIGLLKRIILASSDPEGVVFDPFCGCGTTIYAAEETRRQWIGCDIAILAVHLVRDVLAGKYKLSEGTSFVIDGIPLSVDGARDLFKRRATQFQHWAVERAGGFPSRKYSGDRGIDGLIYFETPAGLKSMVLQVKGGSVGPTDVRDLIGVLKTESGAELAGFISLKEPTRAMLDAGARAGRYNLDSVSYDRVQFLTVGQMLDGKREFACPSKVRRRFGRQPALPLT